MLLGAFLALIGCSKGDSFTLESFSSRIVQTDTTSKKAAQTQIVTTINGESHTLNLDQDLFYDLGEDEFIHLLQNYRVEFEVEQEFITVIVFFDILTDQSLNQTVTCLESAADSPCIPVTNTMTININGEETIVNVDAATVNGFYVSYNDGKFAFDISI